MGPQTYKNGNVMPVPIAAMITSEPGPLPSAQIPGPARLFEIAEDVSSGQISRGATVIFDNEVWKYTPAWEQAHQIHYEQLAAQLAAENGITFINAPYGESTKNDNCGRRGAAKYASVVQVQAQTLDRNPKNYAAFVKKDVAAIRRRNS